MFHFAGVKRLRDSVELMSGKSNTATLSSFEEFLRAANGQVSFNISKAGVTGVTKESADLL